MSELKSDHRLGARIVGTGSCLPRTLVTNESLQRKVKNFDETKAGMPFGKWSETVTGIKQRYYSQPGETAEILGAGAARAALEAAGVQAQEIEFIIACSFTPASLIPNAGCSIGHLIGAPRAGAFCLNTACAGFVYGLAMAYSLIRAEIYSNVLVVAGEVLSLVTDYGDPKTAVLFADGAGAAVLQAAEREGIVSSPFLSSDYSEHIHMKDLHAAVARDPLLPEESELLKRTYLSMPGGPQVLRKAVNAMAEAARNALMVSPYRLEEVSYFIPHQANQRITLGLAEKLGVPADRMVSTIETLGNTSGASVAIALDLAIRGKINGCSISRGDKIVLTAVGGGYSSGAVVFKY